MTISQAVFTDLKDASVLITGGGSGIGAALTEGFARQGAKVAFIDIATDASWALQESLSDQVDHPVHYLEADLRDLDALKGACAEAAELNGPVSVLINNAAWDDRHEIETVTPEYWDNNQAINIRPQFFAVQAVVPAMKKAGRGSIINFTSASFMINQGDLPAYTSAKAGAIGLTKGLAGALGPFGIRVNAVLPGWIMTERQKKEWVTPEALDATINRQCLKRELVPGELVGPCMFLASEASSAITAQTIIVDGGAL